ncbi:MAG: hypothetical protein H0X69_10025 [Gemmatimonadales bacterium]|nr:hypothetical protein [Gemmatimonadales bacterium]
MGKVRSRKRQQPLKHLPHIQEIAAELAGEDTRECHLYLTDYRSLYVGEVDAIGHDGGGGSVPPPRRMRL